MATAPPPPPPTNAPPPPPPPALPVPAPPAPPNLPVPPAPITPSAPVAPPPPPANTPVVPQLPGTAPAPQPAPFAAPATAAAVPISAPSLPAAAPAAKQPAPGQVPAHLYDPTLLNKPLQHQRGIASRIVGRIVRGAVLLTIVAVVGAVAYGVYSQLNPPELPTYVAQPGHQSSTYVEVNQSGDASLTTFVSASMSESTVGVQYEGDAVYFDWVGNTTHWFEMQGKQAPVRYDNVLSADEELRAMLAIADGLTIDEVLPPAMRAYVQIESADRTTMLGRDVKKYVTQVEVGKMAQTDQIAERAFETFWSGGGDPEESPMRLLPSDSLVNVTIWVDDTGMIYKVESKSDFDAELYSLTFSGVASDNSLAPTLPTEFIDAP